MILTDPIPWSLVPVGAQVLLREDDVPRTLQYADTQLHHGRRVVFLEGIAAPMVVEPTTPVRMVVMDETDAVAHLRAAGLTTEIIETKDQ